MYRQSSEQSRPGPDLAWLAEELDFKQTHSFMVRLRLERIKKQRERTVRDMAGVSWRLQHCKWD